MKTRPSSRLLSGILVCFLLCAALTSPAEDGRDFATMYVISNANVGPNTVVVTLTIRLFNHSRVDVTNGTAVLEDPSQEGGSFGSISAVAVRYKANVRLQADFVVTRAEFDSWKQGSQPKMQIEFTDASGNPIQRPIEMAPGPRFAEEEQ